MNDRLWNIAVEAYAQVPLYFQKAQQGINIQNLAETDNWEAVPLTEKNEIVSDGLCALTAWGMPLLMSDRLIVARTSGSTGKYMDIYWKPADYNKSMLPLWYYRYRYYGIRPDDRCCYFYTIGTEEEEKIGCRRMKHELGFSKSFISMDRLAEIMEQIREFSPKWMMLQPGMAALICECMERFHLEPVASVVYIEFTGEILTEEVRRRVQRHFPCRTANQYGANEFNSIAYECPEGHMHILKDNVHVEVLKDGKAVAEGEEGELYITSLTNSVMPLIRYRIGDIGKMYPNHSCACGNRAPILELTSGRSNDFILCEGGEKITAYSLVRAVDYANYRLEGAVKQFQIVQENPKRFLFRLVIDEEETEREELEALIVSSVIDEHLAGAEYRFAYYSELFPDESTGKYRYFINKMKKG